MNPNYVLLTPRLRLRALSLEEAQLAMHSDRPALSARIGAQIPMSWPRSDLAEGLPVIIAEMRQQAGDERWLWVIIEPRSAMVIGDIGFHGPVTGSSAVELGYLILPEHQGHGYATEAALALLDWAFGQPGVERVIARIMPANAASLRVAQKLGMREIASDEPGYRHFERLAPPR